MGDRTLGCWKIQRWFMFRSERLIELGNIWFSTKSILVDRIFLKLNKGKVLLGGRGLTAYLCFEIFE